MAAILMEIRVVCPTGNTLALRRHCWVAGNAATMHMDPNECEAGQGFLRQEGSSVMVKRDSVTGLRLMCLVGLFWTMLAPSVHAEEFRGLWVDAWGKGFKTPQEVTELVDVASGANLNALLVQVRKRGDAYYNSTIEPRARGISHDFDPLADIIAKAHAKGIEVHAWLMLCDTWHVPSTTPPPSGHVYLTHPEWLTESDAGSTLFDGSNIFLDPGNVQVRDYLKSIVLDIATKYAVDGIHLDNAQYPSRHAGYNDASLAAFKLAFGRSDDPAWDDMDWCKWRGDQVSALVSGIYDAVTSVRPSVKVSMAVSPNELEIHKRFFLEWKSLLQAGRLDFVVPMMFTAEPGSLFETLVSDTMKSSYGSHIYIGQGTWQSGADLAIQQLAQVRALNAPGFVLFDYSALVSGPAGSRPIDKIAAVLLTQPASVPPMPWKN
jgi:uncharacterized lipoprotein YddW (UPF0748 family)